MYHHTLLTTLHIRQFLRPGLRIGGALMFIASLCGISAAPAMAQDGSENSATPTGAPSLDRCEPNDSLFAPCALQTEVEQTGLTFADDSVDVYSFLLKAGHVYVVSASSADGIDPAIRVFLAGEETPVAVNDDATAGSTTTSVQIAVPVDAWYVVEVTNHAVSTTEGKTYQVSARSSTAVSTPTTTAQTADVADILENNYDVAHASRIAWGVPYDLTLECPDPRPDACFAGDHDFLLVPVKKGVPLIALTYDLGAGSDTTATLYVPDAAPGASENLIPGWRAVAGNDDIMPGQTLRSQVLYTPTWDGDALLIIAESQRRNPPVVPSALGPAGRYRLIVGSPNMNALQTVLGALGDIAQGTTNPSSATSTALSPTVPRSAATAASTAVATNVAPLSPTAIPTVVAASVAAPAPSASDDGEEIIRENCTTGLAVVARADAPFYSAANPTSARRLLTTYQPGTEITLLGSCYIGWVKAQPDGSVTPGWMFAPDLALVEGTILSDAPAVPTPVMPNLSANSAAATAVGAPTTAKVPVVRAPAPALAPAPTAVPPEAATVVVRVLGASTAGVAGVGVQLVDVYGVVISDAVTGLDGQAAFTFSVQPHVALRVQLPALGVTAPVDLANPLLTVTLPGGGS